jgi:cation diffusion facilitator family transporter
LEAKSKAAAISVASNTTLILLKLVVGLMTGSVSVVSEAIHSGMDLVAAIIAFFSVRSAAKPPDDKHPFGHGKIENVSGTVESVLIFAASVLIIYEATNKLIVGFELESVNLGIGVMAISVIVNILVSRNLFRVAKQTDSVALEADAYHLTTDVYTSLGVMLGLVAVRVTGWKLVDPIMAIGVAIFIGKAAFDISRKSFVDLLDVRLPADEEEKVAAILNEHAGQFIAFHNLRSRKAGAERYIDLHLVTNRFSTVESAHSFCDHIEEDIERQLPHSNVTIHVEPCDQDCDRCSNRCDRPQPDRHEVTI